MAFHTRYGAFYRLAAATSLALVLTACGGAERAPGIGSEERIGSATAAIHLAPADAQCVTIKVVGTTTVHFSFDLPPQASSVFSLVGLPFGNNEFSANAYAERCAVVVSATSPSYFSDKVVAKVGPGLSPMVELTMRRPGTEDTAAAKVGLDFPDEQDFLGTLTQFTLPRGGEPTAIITGPDGNLWISLQPSLGPASLGRLTPSGELKEFPLPEYSGVPIGMVAGPDGNIWVAAWNPVYFASDMVNRITPSGDVTAFEITPAGAGVEGITVGPDGAMWFTQRNHDKIGRITVAGEMVHFNVPPELRRPVSIATGPDGNLWFTSAEVPKIGRLMPGGIFNEFPIPSGAIGQTIIAGPDGHLWFTLRNIRRIARLRTDGSITEFDTNGFPVSLCAGPDGNVWFGTSNRFMTRMTPTGKLTTIAIPSWDNELQGCTSGPDGNLWFVETYGLKIGRITL